MRKVVLLFVDDDPAMHTFVGPALRRRAEGEIEIIDSYSPDEALAQLHDAPPGILVVLSDYDMGVAMTGVDMLRAIGDERPDAVRFLWSGHPAALLAREAEASGVDRVFEKPVRIDELSRAVWSAARAFAESETE